MDLRKRFAEQLRKRRKELGLTQAEVAEKAGMKQGDICDLEKGRHAPTVDTIERLAVSLNVAPAYFFLENLSERTGSRGLETRGMKAGRPRRSKGK